MPENKDFLEQKREEIDALDGIIQSALQARFLLSGEIAVYKFFRGIPVKNELREEEIMSDISSEEIKKVYRSLLIQSINLQNYTFSCPIVVCASSEQEKAVVELLAEYLALPVFRFSEKLPDNAKIIKIVTKDYVPFGEEKVLKFVTGGKTTEQCVDELMKKIYEFYRQPL